jgi:hypothetical protein
MAEMGKNLDSACSSSRDLSRSSSIGGLKRRTAPNKVLDDYTVIEVNMVEITARSYHNKIVRHDCT